MEFCTTTVKCVCNVGGKRISMVQNCTLLSIHEESDIIMLLSKFEAIFCEKDFFKKVGKLFSAASHIYPVRVDYNSELLDLVRTVL